MNASQISVSLVIPVFNEEGSVKQVIEEVLAALEKSGSTFEVIAVNDLSSDKSREILEAISGISVINHARNKGYGASLKTGITASAYDNIMIIDADGTYPTQDIPRLIKHFAENNCDVVIGSRDSNSSSIPLERRHAKKFLNRYASYLASTPIPDINSGLRIFKKSIVLNYWSLFPERFSFTSTLTMASLVHGYSVDFIPIEYYKRQAHSTLKASDFIRFLKLVTKLSFFFKPVRVFLPISIMLFVAALALLLLFVFDVIPVFYDATFIVLCATALQTLFFGILAEIVIYNNK